MTTVAPLLTSSTGKDSRLVRAAIRHGDQVYTDWRHSTIIRHLAGLGILAAQEDQGFIDQHGVFYNRYQAARIAYHAKQIVRIPPLLTSEDLWDDDGTPREPDKAYDPMADSKRKLPQERRGWNPNVDPA